MEVLPQASAKKKTESLKGFKFRTFIGQFQATHMAVKGLKRKRQKGKWYEQ